jgi:hypothetical protein
MLDNWFFSIIVLLKIYTGGHMAKEKLSMRKFKEVLRLKFETDLSNRQIARSCSTAHVTVGKYQE